MSETWASSAMISVLTLSRGIGLHIHAFASSPPQAQDVFKCHQVGEPGYFPVF